MRLAKLVIAMLIALTVASCSSYKDITIEKVSNVNVKEINGSSIIVDLNLQVNNPTGSRVKLNEVNLDIIKKDAKFAHISSVGKVVVPAHSVSERTLTLEVRITNILSSGMMLLGKKLNPDDFTANGYIKVSSFPFSKKIKVENQKVGSLVKGLETLMPGAKR